MGKVYNSVVYLDFRETGTLIFPFSDSKFNLKFKVRNRNAIIGFS